MIITLFVVFELFGLYWARNLGLTKNVGRFVTSVIILLCLIPILNKTIKMWDTYTEKLEKGYEHSQKK